tara:strand:+ start:475 stop:732 length:258 start_codon:yes stop_codon:yes gene_type:complete
MLSASAGGHIGSVTVSVTNGRTKSPEEWAAEITNKILFIADTASPPIRDQALAFRDQMYQVIRDNIALAIEHERTWILEETRRTR